MAIDWNQTRKLTSPANGPNGMNYFERNPLMDKYPAAGDVNRYFMVGMALTTGLAYVLPTDYRRLFLGGTIVIESAFIANNHRIGLRVGF